MLNVERMQPAKIPGNMSAAHIETPLWSETGNALELSKVRYLKESGFKEWFLKPYLKNLIMLSSFECNTKVQYSGTN